MNYLKNWLWRTKLFIESLLEATIKLMIIGFIAFFVMMLVSGCEKETSTQECEPDITPSIVEPEKEETTMNIQFKVLDCPEGCFKDFTMITEVTNNSKYNYDFNLDYSLFLIQDNCGLEELYYSIPNGSLINIYSSDDNLLGAYWIKEECNFEEKDSEYGDLIIRCDGNSERFVHKRLREPERYLSQSDCK